MYYDYYYKSDQELKRITSNYELSNEEVSNVFGANKKVVLLEPITFTREVQVEDAEGKKLTATEQVKVGFVGFVE